MNLIKIINNEINLLNEDPNGIVVDEKPLRFTDRDSLGFGFLDNKAYTTNLGQTHINLFFKYGKEPFKEILTDINAPLNIGDATKLRNYLNYSGRLWINEKIISFWKYPENNQKLIELLQQLQVEDSTLNFNNYKIALPDKTLIPIENFGGGYKRSDDELNKQHILSPLNKQKKEVPSGWGSKYYPDNYPMNQRMSKYEENNLLLKNIINEEIMKLNENISVFHGSDRKFDTFDLNKVGSGDGKGLGGWGIYFSDNEEVSQRYVTSTGFLGRFELRDGNYFDLDEIIDSYTGEKIINKLENLGIDDDQINELRTDYIEYGENYGTVNNKQVYDWLSYVLGGDKQASLFLKSMGYIGNTFIDKWTDGARNYVVFDVSTIIY